ncbi:hypothetical protein BDM02DRAFT_3151818 [Thelephora ganbajun]|uniref:Uncharacterized protein n=1 Tax=Thelephora ganbajun TaxID=370292 RepID=A0ACB6Z0F9_THEGA|nr:hypothetical protein BDM02DRAFT_3151818 [Thelephora ganbajun]
MASPSSPALQRLHHLDASSPNFHDKLHNVLYGEEYANCVPNLKVDDLVWLVEYLDKALDGLDPSAVAFRKCLRELRSVCGANAILPTSYMLLTDLVNIDSIPFASGAYGDVYHGTLNSSRVCIKRIRVYHLGHERATKAFCQEAVMWKYLKHPNILPLLGVTISSLELVSNWMAGGTLPEYIGKYSDVNQIELLCEVANGLHYLSGHSSPNAHRH